MNKYNVAVVSKIALSESGLSQLAQDLGACLAINNCSLLSTVNLSLAYRVAQGISAKSGLSIGFSPAQNYRYHVIDSQLPTDVYDWIYYNQSTDNNSNANLINCSQALILLGASDSHLAELHLALELMLPIGILISEASLKHKFLSHIQTLEAEQKAQIIIESDPKMLIDKLLKLVDNLYQDLNDNILDKNNQAFKRMFDRFS